MKARSFKMKCLTSAMETHIKILLPTNKTVFEKTREFNAKFNQNISSSRYRYFEHHIKVDFPPEINDPKNDRNSMTTLWVTKQTRDIINSKKKRGETTSNYIERSVLCNNTTENSVDKDSINKIVSDALRLQGELIKVMEESEQKIATLSRRVNVLETTDNKKKCSKNHLNIKPQTGPHVFYKCDDCGEVWFGTWGKCKYCGKEFAAPYYDDIRADVCDECLSKNITSKQKTNVPAYPKIKA